MMNPNTNASNLVPPYTASDMGEIQKNQEDEIVLEEEPEYRRGPTLDNAFDPISSSSNNGTARLLESPHSSIEVDPPDGPDLMKESDLSFPPDVNERKIFTYIDGISVIIVTGGVIVAVYSIFRPYDTDFVTVYSVLLTLGACIRMIRKFCTVLSGLDDLFDLLNGYIVGQLTQIIAVWGFGLGLSHLVYKSFVFFQVIFVILPLLPYSIQLLIGRVLVKYLRPENRRDMYEKIGLGGLLPCNEAVNEITRTPTPDGFYYSMAINTSRADSETLDTPATATELEIKEVAWEIGKMFVKYSVSQTENGGEFVTIIWKVVDRATKIDMKPWNDVQKADFIRIINAWMDRPGQAILKEVSSSGLNSRCFTVAEIIDLIDVGYSLCKVKTTHRTITVGAKVDGIFEDCIASFRKISWRWILVPVIVVVIAVVSTLYLGRKKKI